MSHIREVISLQFGHYSNYVGAHFWNIEELSFDYTGNKKTDVIHDVLYREGMTIDGNVTYTPRLLIADLKNSLKALPLSGGLEKEVESTVTDWHQVERLQEPKCEESEYQKYVNDEKLSKSLDKVDLSSNVTTWTDYLYPRYHQRTINIVNDYVQNDQNVPFDKFALGLDVWRDPRFSEDFTENIRRYAEECNNLQGFNMTLDCMDGFGGLASGCLEHLNDQYPNKSILAFPLITPHFPDRNYSDEKSRESSHKKNFVSLVNMAMTFQKLFEHSSLFSPLCCKESWKDLSTPRQFYNFNYNIENYYETSAILASVLNTLSLKFRSGNLQMHLPDLCADMSGYGRKMAASSLGLPFYIKQSEYLIDNLNTVDGSLWTSLTPNCKIENDKVFQHIVVRGIPETRVKLSPEKAKDQLKLPAFKCNSVKEMFEFYFQCTCFISATNVSVSNLGMEVKTPFPKFFSNTLNSDGFVKQFHDDTYPTQVPVIAGLHNGNFLSNTLECLHREVKRIKRATLQKIYNNQFDEESFNDALVNIDEVTSNYQDNFEL